MKYRVLDVDGDYTFGKQEQNFLNSADAVGQAIKTRLKLLLGEWWEQTSEGLPLFQSILGKSGSADNVNGVDLLIQEIIGGTTDVIQITDFSSTLDNRQYSLSCSVETKYGYTALEVTL